MVKIEKWACYDTLCNVLGFHIQNPLAQNAFETISRIIESHGGTISHDTETISFEDNDFLIFKLKYGVHNGRQ